MEKIMVLGASYSLVPLILAAKRLGYYTVVTSIPGEYPGFSIADEICYVDITDPEAVCRAARERQVKGIVTCCMDVGLKSQGYTVSHLGLVGPSWETVQKCTNKYEMKRAFGKAGVNTAPFVQVFSEQDLDIACEKLRFPLIVKAVDQMGSRGIFKCLSREELYQFYPQTMAATKMDYCIVEEFLQGEMFGVEAMVENGRPAFLLPVGNDLHNGNPPFPIGHYVPWQQAELFPAMQEQIVRAIRALGADNCPMDFDMVRVGDKVYIIEATARAGATCLAELTGIRFGVDYYEMIVRLAVGQRVAPYFQNMERTAVCVRLLEAEGTGTVRKITAPAPNGENLVELSFNIREGDKVRRMENGRDRIGQVIVKGNTLKECQSALCKVLEGIQVNVCEEDR